MVPPNDCWVDLGETPGDAAPGLLGLLLGEAAGDVRMVAEVLAAVLGLLPSRTSSRSAFCGSWDGDDAELFLRSAFTAFVELPAGEPAAERLSNRFRDGAGLVPGDDTPRPKEVLVLPAEETGFGLFMTFAQMGMWRSAALLSKRRPQCGHGIFPSL